MEKTKNIKISNSLSGETIIWRYFQLDRFIELIQNNLLHFSKLASFEDLEESELPFKMKLLMTIVLPDGKPGRFHQPFSLIRAQLNEVCVNCWTMDNSENYALWKIYSKDMGIAIKSNVKKLVNSIITQEHELYIEPVVYKNDFNDAFNLHTLIRWKKSPYKFENELRLYCANIPDRELNVTVNLDELIDNIYLSPFMPESLKTVISEWLEMKHPGLYKKLKVSPIKIRKKN